MFLNMSRLPVAALVTVVSMGVGCSSGVVDPSSDSLSEELGTQSCSGDYTVTDNVAASVASCASIKGSLTISGAGVSSLSVLQSLKSVSGTMLVSNTSLVGINLPNLASVGSLAIENNTRLTNLNGLTAFVSANDLMISSNKKLTTIGALKNITSVSGNLEVSYNKNLATLTGLDGIKSVGGNLYVFGAFSEAPSDLSGLRNLTSVGKDLEIADTAATSLSGLASLITVGGWLDVYHNPKLAKCAVPTLKSVHSLLIWENVILPTQLAQKLAKQVGQPTASIWGNLP